MEQNPQAVIVAEEKPKKRIYRNPDGRLLGGLCTGLATFINWDVTLVRLMLTGTLLLACILDAFIFVTPISYLLLWLVIPNADTEQKMDELRGGRDASIPPKGRKAGRILNIVFGVLLIIAGAWFICFGVFMAAVTTLATLSETIMNALASIGFTGLAPLGVTTVVLFALVYFIPAILSVYYGIMLLTTRNSPKWRPGLLLLILWILAVFLFIAVIIIDIASLF